MKVACWSPVRGGGGVTSNIVVIASYLSTFCGIRVGIRSNHFSANMLERYISDTSEVGIVAENMGVFSCPGSPDYLKYLFKYKDVFERRLFKGKRGITKGKRLTLYRPPEPGENPFCGNKGEDVFFLDLSGENNFSAYKALEEADLRMIFLPGDFEAAVSCLKNYSKFLTNSFIVINKGTNSNGFPLLDFRRIYGVAPDNIAVIPFCSSLMSACQRGDVDLMIRRMAENPLHAEYMKKIRILTQKLLNIINGKRVSA